MAALGLALTACGGGGGGGSDDPPASARAANGDFTAANYAAETDQALEPVLLELGFEGTLAAVRPFSAGDATPLPAGAAAPDAPTLRTGRFERWLLRTLLSRHSRIQAMAVVNLDSVPCSGGGSIGLRLTYDNANEFTPGDRIDATPQGCIEDGQLIGGRLSLVLDDYDESASSIGLDARLIADDFGGDALRIDGRARLTYTSNGDATAGRLTARYDGMSVVANSRVFVWNHGYRNDFTLDTETLDFEGQTSVNGRYFDIRQDQSFTLSQSGVLTSGRVSLLDKDGDRVQVDAAGGTSSYTFFAFASSTPLGPVGGTPLGN